MKRVKLILTAIAAIGIVGGALAFKAKTFGSTKYCYTTTTETGALCILTVSSASFLGGANSVKYVTITSTQDCDPGRSCSTIGRTFGN